MDLFVGDTTSGEAEADARDHGPARFEDWSSVPCGQVNRRFEPLICRLMETGATTGNPTVPATATS